MLTAKLLEVADRIIDDVIGGMRLQTLLVALLGTAAVAGAVALRLRRQPGALASGGGAGRSTIGLCP